MLPLQSYFTFEEPNMTIKSMDGVDSTVFSYGTSDVNKSTVASKSHKEAERRRRQRINAHLATLRTLLPSKTKTDKASLLAEVVQHVKELREKYVIMTRKIENGGYSCSYRGSELSSVLPSETDEVKLSCCDGEGGMVKVVLCCEDRPGLNRDLSQVIKSVRGKPVKAEMVSVGGRTKCVVVMHCGGEGTVDIGKLKRALKAVVENRVLGSGLSHLFPDVKRSRVYESGLIDGSRVEMFDHM